MTSQLIVVTIYVSFILFKQVSSQDRDESRPTYHANNGQDNSLTRAPPALAMVTSRPATWLRSLAFNGTRKPSGMTRFRIKPLMGGDAGQRRAFGASRPFITTTTASPMAVTSTDFVSKKVIVSLSCQRNLTLVALNFTEPFRGVVQAGDTTSTCKLRGNGSRGYSLPVPHEDCGTKHVESSGSFFNTLFIRFHPSLETEGDQLKSIVCKFGTGSLNVG